jgi:hypothetical protein
VADRHSSLHTAWGAYVGWQSSCLPAQLQAAAAMLTNAIGVKPSHDSMDDYQMRISLRVKDAEEQSVGV